MSKINDEEALSTIEGTEVLNKQESKEISKPHSGVSAFILEKKDYVEQLYFTKKEYQEYAKENKSIVAGYYSKKRFQGDSKVILYDSKKKELYDIYKKKGKFKKIVGYSMIDAGVFVARVKNRLLVPLIFSTVVTLVVVGGALFFTSKGKSQPMPDKVVAGNPTSSPVPTPDFEVNDDSVSSIKEASGVVYLPKIPDIVVSKKNGIRKLYNPEGNKNKAYLTYEFKDAEGTTIYKSKYVKPGDKFNVDFSSWFDGKKGTYDLTVKVVSYNVDTLETFPFITQDNIKLTIQ